MKREHVEGCEFYACLFIAVARPCVGGEKERERERERRGEKAGSKRGKVVEEEGEYSGTTGFSNPN